jgi:mono/diheme cytochrome c family protein
MRRLLPLLCALACGQRAEAPAEAPAFGLGRVPGPDVQAWDQGVRPDGVGLPAGGGTARDGADVYARKCARCHGPTGVEGPLDHLVGRDEPVGFKLGIHPRGASFVTVGNYWPYATTLYDYLRRAMPADAPGSLTPDEIYALCAWLLWRNDLFPETALDAASLVRVEMPARIRYVPDDRPVGGSRP